MLVLSRLLGESLYITVPGHEPIRVQVVDIRRDRVRLGITASRDVTVDREEVHVARQRTRGKTVAEYVEQLKADGVEIEIVPEPELQQGASDGSHQSD